ncbi:scopoletin glucosyltransferase-like [Magnolia sinica]|uniref:scopoletin glucosyltransferase-like n=1 Tax=Magnolia sinica TaxID=86752 RepID=UPI00265A7AAE|nr:scopoletin glucosyltransferase-like [Magnolia sinica]
MGVESHPLHLFCFPFLAPGHMIPMIDMAKLFAEREARVSIIATPSNASLFEKTIYRTRCSGHRIEIHCLEFPSSVAGLPDGCENLNDIQSIDNLIDFMKAVDMFQEPFEQLVEEHQPDCIISDLFLPWTLDVADKFAIPRLVFNGTSFFSLCVTERIQRYAPHKNVASDMEAFIVPCLPHSIELTKSQIPDFAKAQSGFVEFFERVKEANARSFGVVMNTFYELEPAYVEHYKMELGRKAWNVGPVSLCNRNTVDVAERGKKACIGPDDCLKWLDGNTSASVVYVCFGSLSQFTAPQLLEIALALEASNRPFLWVVGNSEKLSENEWLPDGFEERMQGKGLIMRGWAPQVLILNHPAVGVFVTHCGWNSTLEAISAGVTMVTWPMFAEQFYNEKLITQVLKIGVSVGCRVWVLYEEMERPVIRRDQIEKVITLMMDGGEEAEGMRKRAKELGEMANRAVEVGGSSYADMSRLIEELKTYSLKAK